MPGETVERVNPFQTTAHSPAATANHALWLEHARAENKRELDRLLATLLDECEYEVVPMRLKWRGKDEVRAFYQGLWSAIPDVKLTLLHRVDAEDCVVEESEVYGNMQGSLFGIEPTGAAVRYRVVIFFPVRDGLFTGERIYFDLAELARQVPGARRLVEAKPA